MSFFTLIGETSRPPCSCSKAQQVYQRMEHYIRTAPEHHADDYSIHTGKPDTTLEEVCLYSMRDAMQWWSHWYGTLEDHYWKKTLIGISTVPDDVMIPPQDLASGRFRFLGNSLSDILAGLRSEGMSPEDIILIEHYLLRQYIIQYLEKADSETMQMLRGNITLMLRWRGLTSFCAGASIAVVAARGIPLAAISNTGVELASVAQLIGLDICKETRGILQGEATETVVGAGDREQQKREMRWVQARLIERLNLCPEGNYLKPYATSSFRYFFMMDRYRERLIQRRLPLTDAQSRLLQRQIRAAGGVGDMGYRSGNETKHGKGVNGWDTAIESVHIENLV
ncbi:hypothetical protein HFD88_002637 [Aspergillus terreus]|nr:hypothetical protein HFD88_002637 [Aspergillus terreus]